MKPPLKNRACFCAWRKFAYFSIRGYVMRGINSGSMNPAPMVMVTTVTFFVAVAPVSSQLANTNANTLSGDCTGADNATKNVKVVKPNTTVELKCDTADDEVKPPFTDDPFKVCTNSACSEPPELSKYVPGATGKGKDKTTATVVINDLPSEEKTFYFQCGKTNPCYILVKVEASKPGGVAPGSPVSCATPGGAITIKIPEKGSTAHFTCGSWTLYPVATDRVFAEDCKKEESLKGIVRSTEAKVYTLKADTKPPKKKWCFLCASSSVSSNHLGTASDYCLVHVESSSRTKSSAVIALAAMLPCVLAMLRLT